MALTPSLYHSKLSSIFFNVVYVDPAWFRSSSSVCACFTCLPRDLFFSPSCSLMMSIRSLRSSISDLYEASFFSALASLFWRSDTFRLVAASSLAIILRRLFRLSLFVVAF